MSTNQAWHVLPAGQGQIVTDRWMDVGIAGAICWTYDASDRTSTYHLHPWLEDGEFAPWNGELGVAKRGRQITEAEAKVMIEACE